MREGSAGGASYGSNHPRGPGRDEDVEDGGILAASGIASSGGRRVVRHERAAVLGKWWKLVDVRAAAPRPRSFDVGVHRWAAGWGCGIQRLPRVPAACCAGCFRSVGRKSGDVGGGPDLVR